jgi:hypothetical protein
MSFPEETPSIDIEPESAPSPMIDRNGEEFDPARHRTDSNGNPVRNKDGSYAKKRGRKPGQRVTSRGGSKQSVDYRPGINGIFQAICIPLSLTAPADAIAVSHHGPNIAKALNELAHERPEVAAALEKILAVGPYGAVVAATIPLVVQLMHNHGAIPEKIASSMGATPKHVIEAQLRLRAEQFTQEQSVNGEHAYANA